MTREALTTTFFRELLGIRLFFVCLRARFRPVLMANTPRRSFGETAPFLDDVFSFPCFFLALSRAL